MMKLFVNIDVDDLDKAVRFYASALGLNVGRRFGASAVELLGSDSPIYLLLKASGTVTSDTTTQRRTYERHWTPVHLDFVVENIEKATERALAAGAKLEGPLARTSGANWP
jgi:catechol 2,3-dioxygenase-like lactoylglutathione lyase family enzyme